MESILSPFRMSSVMAGEHGCFSLQILDSPASWEENKLLIPCPIPTLSQPAPGASASARFSSTRLWHKRKGITKVAVQPSSVTIIKGPWITAKSVEERNFYPGSRAPYPWCHCFLYSCRIHQFIVRATQDTWNTRAQLGCCLEHQRYSRNSFLFPLT